MSWATVLLEHYLKALRLLSMLRESRKTAARSATRRTRTT